MGARSSERRGNSGPDPARGPRPRRPGGEPVGQRARELIGHVGGRDGADLDTEVTDPRGRRPTRTPGRHPRDHSPGRPSLGCRRSAEIRVLNFNRLRWNEADLPGLLLLAGGIQPIGLPALGDVAQLARAPALQAGGRGFESHHLHSLSYSNRHTLKMSLKGGWYCSWQSQPSFTSRRSNTAALTACGCGRWPCGRRRRSG
jgi:hypothetical protein